MMKFIGTLVTLIILAVAVACLVCLVMASQEGISFLAELESWFGISSEAAEEAAAALSSLVG